MSDQSESPKGVAAFVASLFTGPPVDLSFAVQGLNEIRRSLVAGLFADYVALRFDDDRDASAPPRPVPPSSAQRSTSSHLYPPS
jgi:hypothetical protein